MPFQLLESHDTEYLLLTTGSDALWSYLFWHNFVDSWGFVHPVNCWMLLIGLFMLPKSRPHCLHTRRSRISFVEGQDNRKEYLFEIPFFAFSRRRLALKARFWNSDIYLGSLSDFVHLILKGSSKGLSTFISKDGETNTFLRWYLH